MTAEQFEQVCVRIYGPHFQSTVAADLLVNVRTVRNWLPGGRTSKIPSWIVDDLASIAAAKAEQIQSAIDQLRMARAA